MAVVSAVVRKVQASDRQDILDISSKIWNGHDYLPSVIDEWLENPQCHTYGVEVDCRLVAIGNLRLVDRKATGWMEGLRVHPDFRKRGYADMLTQHFLNLGRTLNVEQLRYTTSGNNRASLKLARKAGFKRTLKMSAFWHENIDKTLEPQQVRRSIVKVTPQEAHELLKTNPALAPRNMLIYDWKAINGTLQGFRGIGKNLDFYCTKRKSKLQALSFGHARPDSEQNRQSFTIYALHERELIAHFRYQLNTALNKGIRATVCTCPTQFKNIFIEHKRIPKFEWKIQLVLLEKKID